MNNKKQNGALSFEGVKSLTVVKEIGGNSLISLDDKVTNGLIRAEYAVEQHADKLIKKGTNFALLTAAKIISDVIIGDNEIKDLVLDTALTLSGASLALEAKKALDTAIEMSEEELEQRRKKYLESISSDCKGLTLDI